MSAFETASIAARVSHAGSEDAGPVIRVAERSQHLQPAAVCRNTGEMEQPYNPYAASASANEASTSGIQPSHSKAAAKSSGRAASEDDGPKPKRQRISTACCKAEPLRPDRLARRFSLISCSFRMYFVLLK